MEALYVIGILAAAFLAKWLYDLQRERERQYTAIEWRDKMRELRIGGYKVQRIK